MMKSIRCLGLALLASICFAPFAFAVEPLAAYLSPGYMYATAESEFSAVLAYHAALPDTPTTGTGTGLLRDSHGYLQYSADEAGQGEPLDASTATLNV